MAALTLGFAIIYYLGPDVEQRFKWVSPGSVIGVALLIGASIGALSFVLAIVAFGAGSSPFGGRRHQGFWKRVG